MYTIIFYLIVVNIDHLTHRRSSGCSWEGCTSRRKDAALQSSQPATTPASAPLGALHDWVGAESHQKGRHAACEPMVLHCRRHGWWHLVTQSCACGERSQKCRRSCAIIWFTFQHAVTIFACSSRPDAHFSGSLAVTRSLPKGFPGPAAPRKPFPLTSPRLAHLVAVGGGRLKGASKDHQRTLELLLLACRRKSCAVRAAAAERESVRDHPSKAPGQCPVANATDHHHHHTKEQLHVAAAGRGAAAAAPHLQGVQP